MKLQKRHIALSALVVALGAAVFINWQFNGADKSLIDDVSKELGAATYVNADTSSPDQVTGVSRQTTATDEYFAKAVVERDRVRGDAIDLAKETLKLADSSDEAKTAAVEQLNNLEDAVVIESNVENILKAKGFSQALCMISDESCYVAVLKKEMKENSPLIIKDAVVTQSDIEFNNITIVEV